MLRDEVKLFERLSGESANNVTIERLGSFLDGYFVGKEESVIHAHWRLVSLNLWDCTNCHYVVDRWDRKTPYCPDCGAKMDEGVDNDTI